MKNRNAGFTLIELLITIAILGILAAVGTPSLQFLIATNRLKSAATDMHTMLVLARSEAVKRNADVTLTPVSASDWSQGWSVRSGTQVIASQDAYAGLSFSPRNAAYTTKTVSTVTFTGTGRENSLDGIAFVISAPDYSTVPSRCVILDPSGRPAVRKDQDSDPADGCN